MNACREGDDIPDERPIRVIAYGDQFCQPTTATRSECPPLAPALSRPWPCGYSKPASVLIAV
jgi:hypothetical protein